MSLYVIARKTSDDVLDTVIFHAGESGQQEAVAIFTSEAAALEYIKEAGWDEPHEAVELTPIATLQWVQQAHNQGVKYLALDPKRQGQVAGDAQTVFSIKDQLARCAEALVAGMGATDN